MKDKHKDKVRLKHILEAIADATLFMEGRTFQSLYDDKMLLAAVERKVEIIGEATNHISLETHKKNILKYLGDRLLAFVMLFLTSILLLI